MNLQKEKKKIQVQLFNNSSGGQDLEKLMTTRETSITYFLMQKKKNFNLLFFQTFN